MTAQNLDAKRLQISFVHPAYPTSCISPNLMTAEGVDEYPGFSGTGFFARRGDTVFYITARHCLTMDQDADVAALAARLHIPYSLAARTESTDDYVQFEDVLSLKHESDDVPGRFIDVLVLTVRRPTGAALYNELLERAVKLPYNGQWLDQFVNHPSAKEDLESGKGIRFTVMGYPREGTASQIEYPEDEPVEIVTQAARFSGYLARGTGPDRYMLTEVDWPGDLSGFSGSPVIVGFRNDEGSNYALAGMLVSGGGRLAQFIKISLITEALKAPPG
ncbi:hypothetical protein [Ideonella sp. YS5]|uniref:hypothetical protein n=1 Tax=Ideonella sp. YS5 TaxID=3453714 RepID=UPI003EEB76BB